MGAPLSHIVGFVDNDDVPIGTLKMMTVLNILFEGIDGNNRAIKIEKRIVIGRNAIAHTLKTNGIQTHQRNRKAIPKFLLKLGEHGFHRQHQNPLAAAAGN